jgi:hypothetical protein
MSISFRAVAEGTFHAEANHAPSVFASSRLAQGAFQGSASGTRFTMRSSCQNPSPRPISPKRPTFREALISPVDTIEMHDGVALLVLGIHLEPEFAADFGHSILPFTEPSAPDRNDATVGSGPIPNASADAIARLDEYDRFSTLPQPPRRGKACETSIHRNSPQRSRSVRSVFLKVGCCWGPFRFRTSVLP